jgi:hypothetical protein
MQIQILRSHFDRKMRAERRTQQATARIFVTCHAPNFAQISNKKRKSKNSCQTLADTNNPTRQPRVGSQGSSKRERLGSLSWLLLS